jgi:FkbM family methyltransferase
VPTFKRRIANVIEKLSGNLVIPPYEVYRGPEKMLLRQFFAHFGVDCVFDVGANKGQYATHLREDIFYRGPIISYEPIPELAAGLRAQAAGAHNWHVEQLALDREAGPAVFNIMAEDQFSSLRRPAPDQPAIFNADNRVAREVEVMRATLSEELPRWQERLGFRRPFLKMDTQGNDLAVVQGAGAALGIFVGLQSELSIRRLYAGAPNYAETIDQYTSMGFELTGLIPNNKGHFPLLVEIDCVMHRRGAEQFTTA